MVQSKLKEWLAKSQYDPTCAANVMHNLQVQGDYNYNLPVTTAAAVLYQTKNEQVIFATSVGVCSVGGESGIGMNGGNGNGGGVVTVTASSASTAAHISPVLIEWGIGF